MKLARFFGGIFAFVGLVLMVGTAGLVATNLNAPVRMGAVPQEAQDCLTAVMDSVAEGNFDNAGVRMYGWPAMGTDRLPEDPDVQKFWQAYVDSLEWEEEGDFFSTDRGYGRKCQVKALDVLGAADKAQELAFALLEERRNSAEDPLSLYDEELNILPQIIDEAMAQGIAQAVAEPELVKTLETTVELVYRDGQWWVIPDETLLAILRGNLG